VSRGEVAPPSAIVVRRCAPGAADERAVRRSTSGPAAPSSIRFVCMKLVMTLKVRDEEDVLEANLRYHLAQGIDFFIVTDNGSVDRTSEILATYQRAGLMHLLDDDSPDYFAMHGEWVSQMARLAASDFGADWVIHTDADE